jgi:hypothetical protein
MTAPPDIHDLHRALKAWAKANGHVVRGGGGPHGGTVFLNEAIT